MNPRIVPLVVAICVTLGACAANGTGRTDPGATAPPASFVGDEADVAASTGAVVTITASRFDALELRVTAGTTVTFVNDDPFAHTVTSRPDAPMEFHSGDLGQGETFEVTFDAAGEYAYFCEIHPTMRAVVIVG